jgi:AraC family transcriptional regulator, positive regulator of tynA and feaB
MRAKTEFDISPTPQLDLWRVEVCSDDTRNDEAKFDALVSRVAFTRLCGLPAVDVDTTPFASARRTWRHTRRDNVDDYKMIFQVSGSSFVHQDDITTALQPGDFGLVDLARPIDLIKGDRDGRLVGLHLPRQSLIAHLGFQPQGGRCWRGQDTLPARLLKQLLADSLADDSTASDDAQNFLQLAIYNLVGSLFSMDDLPRHFSQNDKLFLRVCAIIKHHFANPDIGPGEVAAEAGISLRYLQKIFAMRNTTSGRFLKTLRLNHAASMLHHRSETIARPCLTEIAISCGYRDYAHFARDFRARYGQPPGAFSRTAIRSRADRLPTACN